MSVKVIVIGNKVIKYVEVDTDQNIFDNINPKDYSKVAKQVILEKFKGRNLIVSENIISITRLTANEYTHSRKKIQRIIYFGKMKASTELDNLIEVARYLYSSLDDGRHSFAKDGWDYYLTVFKVDDKFYTGLINIAKNGNKRMLYDITNIKKKYPNQFTSNNCD